MTDALGRKADAYASLAHLGQWRVEALGPACGVGYIEHPRAVARILREMHPDPALHASLVQQIALLHRTLWRGNADPDQLELVFGREVAAGVRLLSPWLRARPATHKDEDTYWPRLPRAPRVLRAVVGAAWLDELDAAGRWPQAYDSVALRAEVQDRVLPLLHDDPWLSMMLEASLDAIDADAGDDALTEAP